MPIIRLNDLPLYYQDSGDGPETLLALHPSTVGGDMLRWALPQNNRFRILLPDQRGHGNTPNPAPDFHLARLVDDMLGLLDALDVPQVHGVGYSLGTSVLLGIAAQAPERIKSLILIGATHRRPTQEQLSQVAGPPEERAGLVREVMDPEYGSSVGWEFRLAEFARVSGPVHLIIGDRDPVAPLEDALALYHALPQGRLFVAPHCDHFGYYQSDLVKAYLQEAYDQSAP